jgi:tryptophan synthase alpha chain
MNRDVLVAALARQRRHLSPFLVLGDPTPELSLELALAAVAAGATVLELGLPFSDPCADGPAIQGATRRARAAGVSTREAFALVRALADAAPAVPLNLLAYANLVHARGTAAFCEEAAAAGVSSLLVPDVPFGEDLELNAACRDHGLAFVRMVGPGTAPDRIVALARDADLLYVAALQGVTGAAGGDAAQRSELLRRARAAFASGAAIAIVGSHLARAIERGVALAAAPGGALGADVLREFRAALVPLLDGVEVPQFTSPNASELPSCS